MIQVWEQKQMFNSENFQGSAGSTLTEKWADNLVSKGTAALGVLQHLVFIIRSIF